MMGEPLSVSCQQAYGKKFAFLCCEKKMEPTIHECPGVFWIYDRPTKCEAQDNVYCVMSDINDRHLSMHIPILKTPSGIVQRTIWTLWTTADEMADDGCSMYASDGSIIATRMEDRLFSLVKTECVRERTRGAAIAHYASMGGVFDILHDERMSSSVTGPDRRIIGALHAISITAALKILAATKDEALSRLKPIVTAHKDMIKLLKIDIEPIEQFRTQLCAVVNRVCGTTLHVDPGAFMGDTYTALEQMGVSALVAMHMSTTECSLSEDMASSSEKQNRVMATYQLVCQEVGVIEDRLDLLVEVLRVLLVAASHGGNISKGLGIFGIMVDRADEIGSCAVCAQPVCKLNIALGKVHLCPRAKDLNHMVCDKCGGDMACSMCIDATVSIDFCDVAMKTVCDNVLLSLKVQRRNDALSKQVTPPPSSPRENELRRALHEAKASLQELRASAKRDRRKSRSLMCTPVNSEVQTETMVQPRFVEAAVQTNRRDAHYFARMWLDKSRQRRVATARTRQTADAERICELESRCKLYATLCTTIRSTLDLSGLAHSLHPEKP